MIGVGVNSGLGMSAGKPSGPPAPSKQYALSFDGIDDYVNLGNLSGTAISDPSTSNALTVEAWVNLKGGWYIFTSGGQTDSTGFAITYNAVMLKDGDEFWQIDYTFTHDVWMHIACTWDGTTLILYVDGIVAATQNTTSPYATSDNVTVFLLGKPNLFDSNFSGEFLLRDIRIWNVVRSQADVQNNMDSSLLGSESGLILYCPVDEGSGSTITDHSPNSYDGSITGASWVEV